MTPPMTPREKAEPSLSDLLRQAVETMKSWTPEQREAHFEAQKKAWVASEMAFGDEGTRVITALASGSGDHAELARLAEAATPGPWSYRDMRPNTYGPAFVDSAKVQSLAICGEAVGLSETHGFCLQVDSEVRMANAAFIAAANPTTVLAILAENAALRAERDEWRNTVRFNERCWSEERGVMIDRATEAERKLAEAERLNDRAADLMRQCTDPERFVGASTLNVYANMRAWLSDLSKEAERG